MGFVFDRSLGQIRTVVGIPGAARVTDPVKLDFKLEHALVVPGGALAVASVSGGSALTVVGALDSEPTAVPVENSMADFDFGAFNGPGTTAILYGSGCKCIQVIDGLPDAPRVSRNIDSTSFPGAVLALAVSDDQSIAAVAVASSEDGISPSRILLFDLNGDSTPPPIITSASSLAFTPNQKDLVVTDAPSGLVSLALNAGGVVDVASALVSTGSDAISNPGAIAFTNDGLLLIADRAGLVHIIDLQTKERRSAGCRCRPDSMERMRDKSTYRLTGIEAGSIWILDTSGANPRTLFVPIDAPANTESLPAEIAQ
jgi:DNA-binding beta-propeller fold protein YncE